MWRPLAKATLIYAAVVAARNKASCRPNAADWEYTIPLVTIMVYTIVHSANSFWNNYSIPNANVYRFSSVSLITVH